MVVRACVYRPILPKPPQSNGTDTGGSDGTRHFHSVQNSLALEKRVGIDIGLCELLLLGAAAGESMRDRLI